MKMKVRLTLLFHHYYNIVCLYLSILLYLLLFLVELDSLDSTVINAWGNAYSALDQFNVGQLNVLDTLNQLAIKMNDFNSSVQNAANNLSNLNSMPSAPPTTNSNQSSINSLKQQLDSAYKQQQMMYMYGGDPKQIQSQIDYLLKQIRDAEEHHTGVNSGVVGGGNPVLKSNEIFTKLIKGEIVLTSQQVDTFMNSILPNMYTDMSNKAISSLISDAKTIDTQLISSNQSQPFIINQGDINVTGSMDKSVLPQIQAYLKNNAADITNIICKTINRQSTYGSFNKRLV